MKKQAGFTLIELVIVIIILGIIAATAVPKFIDLQSDARASSLKGVKAALEGAATLTYSIAAIENIEKEKNIKTQDGIRIRYGYPRARNAGIINAVELDTNDWTVARSGAVMTISAFVEGDTPTVGCNVTYTELTNTTKDERPTITVDDSDC